MFAVTVIVFEIIMAIVYGISFKVSPKADT